MLDAFGALHPVTGAPELADAVLAGLADRARRAGRTPSGSGGYILDGYGGVSPVGGAPRIARHAVLRP